MLISSCEITTIMQRNTQGHYITISTVGAERVRAFVPAPLPPVPPLFWDPALREAFDRALLALGRLDSMALLLPETSLFLYQYIRKEAVLSSQIEGTQSSLADLLLFEFDQAPGVPREDVQEVSNYVAALEHGLARLGEGFPLSLRLLREMHGVLLAKGRGSDRSPGEFRRSQNWIGGSRPGTAAFVPPPPEEVAPCMGALELFLHDRPEPTPALVKAALAHVQFETIHPFLDGNGRLGRLLITLILCAEQVLCKPLLYLSLYFKTHRRQYYDSLTVVREHGDWEAWLLFFAQAVLRTAEGAVATAQRLLRQAEEDRARIHAVRRMTASLLRVHQALQERPIASASWLAAHTGLAPATVNEALRVLQGQGILAEITGQRRNRLYRYQAYLQIMNEGTEVG
jgi:Fic family protein